MTEVFDGKFRLGRLLGRGGMGEVYEAEQVAVHRKVALKLLRPGLATDPEAVKRLQREAETLAALDHPNLVRFYDFGVASDGQVYLVMELLEGEDIQQIIDRAGPAPFDRIVPILVDVLSALEACHAKGFIHRDLKPSNVFLAQAPGGGATTKVLDFGVARVVTYEGTALTVTGGFVGTPAYMAPEQARGEDIDFRADLYSVGAVLYHSLTAKAPYEATTLQGVLARVLTEDPPTLRERRPDLVIPEVADRICNWAMARNREKRPKSAREMREALQETMAGRQSLPLLPKATRPRKGGRGAGIWALGLLLLGGGIAAGAIGAASIGSGGTTAAAGAPATAVPSTAVPTTAAPMTSRVPMVEIVPNLPTIRTAAPATAAPPQPASVLTQLGPMTDAQISAALARPQCQAAPPIQQLHATIRGAGPFALSLASMSNPACGDCTAFARAAVRQNPTWDLPHFQLAMCLVGRQQAADYCTVADEVRRFQQLASRPQPASTFRRAYRQTAPQLLETYVRLCRESR